MKLSVEFENFITNNIKKLVKIAYVIFLVLFLFTVSRLIHFYIKGDMEGLYGTFILFFILPIIIWIFFWFKTRNARKIDFTNIQRKKLEKLYEAIEKSENYVSRIPYLFSKGFFLKSFIIHFILLWCAPFLVFSLFLLLEKNIFFLLFTLFFILCVLSFIILLYDSIEKKCSDVSFLKFCKLLFFGKREPYTEGLFISILGFLLIILIVLLFKEGFFDEIINEIGNATIGEFLSLNPDLVGKHIDVAHICFLLFAGCLIILGILQKYFQIEKDTENAFEKFKENLENEYEKIKANKRIRENFLFYLFENRKNILKKIEKTLKFRICHVLIVKKMIRRTAFCGYFYGGFGILFLLLHIGTEKTETGAYIGISESYFTIDLVLLIFFIFLVILHALMFLPLVESK